MRSILSIGCILLISNIAYTQDVIFNIVGHYELPVIARSDTVKTISDLNDRYDPDWVSEYYSVEIETTCNGVRRKATSPDDTLTQEQLDILSCADSYSEVIYRINYIPNNSLSSNDAHEMKYVMTAPPIKEATYTKGSKVLEAYLKEHTQDKIPDHFVTEMFLAKVCFVIEDDGKVSDVSVCKSSEDDAVDNLMLEAICNMTDWIPAVDGDGKNIRQELIFSMGTRGICLPDNPLREYYINKSELIAKSYE